MIHVRYDNGEYNDSVEDEWNVACGCRTHDDHLDCNVSCRAYGCMQPVNYYVTADTPREAKAMSGAWIAEPPTVEDVDAPEILGDFMVAAAALVTELAELRAKIAEVKVARRAWAEPGSLVFGNVDEMRAFKRAGDDVDRILGAE